jgi:hypothetical protein
MPSLLKEARVPDLYARKLTALVPACDTGRHIHHPGITCAQMDEEIEWMDEYFAAELSKTLGRKITPMSEVPPALRGPNWKATP